MNVDLTHKEANLLNAILWELGEERSTVIGGEFWRLSDRGRDISRRISTKLENANDEANNETGKDRDLSGSPQGTILNARWSA